MPTRYGLLAGFADALMLTKALRANLCPVGFRSLCSQTAATVSGQASDVIITDCCAKLVSGRELLRVPCVRNSYDE
jgi:hypothetical protein